MCLSLYLLLSLDRYTGPSHPASASPDLQTPPFPQYVLTQPDGSPLPFCASSSLPVSLDTYTHTQFAIPLGPLPQMHFARSSSRTSFSSHNKVSLSAKQCAMVYTARGFDWILQDVIPAVLIGQASGRPTQMSRCSPTRLAGCGCVAETKPSLNLHCKVLAKSGGSHMCKHDVLIVGIACCHYTHLLPGHTCLCRRRGGVPPPRHRTSI